MSDAGRSPFQAGSTSIQNLERHEEYPDTPDVPHVIVLEASGRSESPSEMLAGPRADFDQAMES